MQKKLLSGLFWVLLLNLIVKPAWILGIEVGVQNAVGNSMYGFYFAIFNIAYIFNILLDVGITNFNTRNIAQHPQLVQKHLSNILVTKGLLLGLYLVATFGAGLLLGYGSAEFRLLAWLCLNQFLNSLILYLRSNLEGLMMFRWDSVVSVMDRLLMIAICGLMLWGPGVAADGGFTIYHFVYAQTAAYLVTALLALAVIVRKSGLRRLRWNPRLVLVVLRQSLPFALLVLLMATYNRLDPVLIRLMASDAEAGVYAGAFRLLDALTMVAYLVSVPLLPVYARLTTRGREDRAELAAVTRLVFPALMAFAVGSAVTLSAMAEPLMRFFYGEGHEVYVGVFRVLIFSIIPISVTYVVGTLLTAGGCLRQLNLYAAISLGVNVGLNLWLIPLWGGQGSAWASLGAQGFMAVAQAVLAARLFALPVGTFCLGRTVVFAAVMVAANLACRWAGMDWPVWLVAMVLLAVALSLLLRMINIRSIAKIV